MTAIQRTSLLSLVVDDAFAAAIKRRGRAMRGTA
jgi:hypothetical protein